MLRVKHVTLDLINLTVTIFLPVSKTDVTAIGKQRTWGCLCRPSIKVPCPFHAAVIVSNRLRDLFKGEPPPDAPFFPDSKGNTSSKEQMVHLIEFIAAQTGESLRDSEGCKRFGGHSFRVTGARWLAALGVELAKIMIMARWYSMVILRYVEETPIARITDEVRCKIDHTSSGYLRAVDRQFAADVQKQMPSVAASESNSLGSSDVDRTIINLESFVVHKVASMSIDNPPATWATCCGWPFGLKRHRVTILASKDRKCEKCFPEVNYDSDEDALS